MADSIVEGRLRRLIASLRREGPTHIFEVLRHHRRRKKYAASGPQLPRIPGVPDSAGAIIPERIDLLLERAARLTTPWTLDAACRTSTLESLSKTSGAQIITDAGNFAAGRFTLLGLSINEPNGTFDWHRDYASGKTWPLNRFDQIAFLSGDGSDVKIPWELSRLHGIGWLGLAHQLDPTQKFETTGETAVQAFRRLIDHWIEENPFGQGVNWAMPMEVALRSFWLIAGAALFREAEGLDETWWSRYAQVIAGHGDALYHTLEYLPNLTNHYIADCFGLVTVGALFADTSEGNLWFHDGRRRLERELLRQVTPDGFHYERSLPYHGLVLELYLVASLIASRQGTPLSEISWRIIDRMAEVTNATIPAPGRPIPLFGDADDGRLLRLKSTTDLYDHTFLLHLHRRAHGLEEPSDAPEALFLYGCRDDSDHQKSRGAITHSLPDPRQDRLTLFEEGGIAVMRSEELTCMVDVGPIGLHGNNDTLSFALFSAEGDPCVIDPGTGCYTGNPTLRNELRSTGAHNGVMVDRREVAEFAGLWRVREDRTRPVVVQTDPELVVCHHAYSDEGIVVERTINMSRPDQCRVTDRVIGSGRHELATTFTLHPDLVARREGDEIVVEGEGRRPLGLHVEGADSVEIIEGISSPSYGLLLPTITLRVDASRVLTAEILYLWRLL